MELGELEKAFRRAAHDEKNPPFWSPEEVAQLFTDAHEEAVLRQRLLYEASNPAMCEIAIEIGTSEYKLDRRWLEIVSAGYAPAGRTSRDTLKLLTVETMDAGSCSWRDDGWTAQDWVIVDGRTLRLTGLPRRAGTIYLEGYRRPMRPLEAPEDVPEIEEVHHRFLVHWALHAAFGDEDADCFNANKSMQELAKFEQYFGLRSNAKLKRWTRHDLPHHNTPILP